MSKTIRLRWHSEILELRLPVFLRSRLSSRVQGTRTRTSSKKLVMKCSQKIAALYRQQLLRLLLHKRLTLDENNQIYAFTISYFFHSFLSHRARYFCHCNSYVEDERDSSFENREEKCYFKMFIVCWIQKGVRILGSRIGETGPVLPSFIRLVSRFSRTRRAIYPLSTTFRAVPSFGKLVSDFVS